VARLDIELWKQKLEQMRAEMLETIRSRLNEIFEAANTQTPIAVKVCIDADCKSWVAYNIDLDAGDHPIEVVLYGEAEEQVFKLFRYPELYSKFVEEWVREKILGDIEWFRRYQEDIHTARRELRTQFKEQLFTEATVLVLASIKKLINHYIDDIIRELTATDELKA